MTIAEALDLTDKPDINFAGTGPGSLETGSFNANAVFDDAPEEVVNGGDGMIEERRNAKTLFPASPLNENYRIIRFSDSPQGMEESPRGTSEEVLQDWEGVVETIGDGTFTALLRDLTRYEARPHETADFSIEDISKDDRELLEPGAIFFFTVGRSTKPNGQQERFARVEFRRLPVWTDADLKRAEARAQRLARSLGLES